MSSVMDFFKFYFRHFSDYYSSEVKHSYFKNYLLGSRDLSPTSLQEPVEITILELKRDKSVALKKLSRLGNKYKLILTALLIT